MDNELQSLLDELTSLDGVKVLEGENPVTNLSDALRLAERHGIIFRYVKDGERYLVRWQEDVPPVSYPESELCLEIVLRTIDMFVIKNTTVIADTEPIIIPQTLEDIDPAAEALLGEGPADEEALMEMLVESEEEIEAIKMAELLEDPELTEADEELYRSIFPEDEEE